MPFIDDDEESVEEYKEQIGLTEQKSKSGGLKDFLKWYLTIDFKDWTNYAAIALAAFLFWWGIKNIIKAMAL